jgi:hypothetical protein
MRRRRTGFGSVSGAFKHVPRHRPPIRETLMTVSFLLFANIPTDPPLPDEPDGPLWIILLSIGLLIACVATHYGVFRLLTRFLHRAPALSKSRIGLLILAILFTHLVEINYFALGIQLIETTHDEQQLRPRPEQYGDYFYFSAVTYTTLGFGDIVPDGALRTLVAVEALTGMVMVGWSVSFTFLLMQRFWKDE